MISFQIASCLFWAISSITFDQVRAYISSTGVRVSNREAIRAISSTDPGPSSMIGRKKPGRWALRRARSVRPRTTEVFPLLASVAVI